MLPPVAETLVLTLVSPLAASETPFAPAMEPDRVRDPPVAVNPTVPALTVPAAELVRLVAAVTAKLPSAADAPEILGEPAALIATLPLEALALKFATLILSAVVEPMLPPVDLRLSVEVLTAAKAPLSILLPAVSETLVVPVIVPARERELPVAVRFTVAALTVPADELARSLAAVTAKLPDAADGPEILVEPAALIATLPLEALALKFATLTLRAVVEPMLPPVDVRGRVGVLAVAKASLSILLLAVSETLVVPAIVPARARDP